MTEILLPKKNVIFDATVFSTVMACARLADFRFNMDLVGINGKGNAIEAGILVHTILEFYYKARRNGKMHGPATDAGFDCGLTQFNNNETPCVPLDNTFYQNGHINEIGWNYIVSTMEEYFNHYKNDSWIPIDVEEVRQVILYEDDEIRVMWKSKLDLTVDTNNGIYPVDHKTSKARKDTFQLNNQFMGQCIVNKTRNVIIDKIGWQKSLKASEKFTRPIMNYSLSQLTEWSQVIVPFWAKLYLAYVETGYWPPNFTYCENKFGLCQFYGVCNSDSGLREDTLRLNFVRGPKWDVQNKAEEE